MQAHVFYSLWICLLRWNGVQKHLINETAVLHTSCPNSRLDETFYRTSSGEFYPAIARINAVRLVLKAIVTSLNPSCHNVFEAVCGNALKSLLNFLQFGCLPNPARIHECPPGTESLTSSLVNLIALEHFITLNCSDYDLANDRFKVAYSTKCYSAANCPCCGWHNTWERVTAQKITGCEEE